MNYVKIVITGAQGSGKTRIARQIARMLQQNEIPINILGKGEDVHDLAPPYSEQPLNDLCGKTETVIEIKQLRR